MLDWTKRGVLTGARQDRNVPRTTDQQGGLVAGTLVATEAGWMPAEKIGVGAMVMTFDDGLQEVAGVTRRLHPMPCHKANEMTMLRPLLSVPAGTIGNRRQMLLPEGQAVMVESDFAEAYLGDPFAALESSELLGLQGVRKVLPEDRVVVVTLSFAEDQMIFVEGQALAHCRASGVGEPLSVEEAIWPETAQRYRVLSHDDAELVVAGMASLDEVTHATHPAHRGAPLS
ncbi:Hint domain-containing protein [Aliiruegeria lutimaris]|uniref:Hint domain-containing protein n=1 Tax=Aliiruegeria lutimaris TaxID=571298 RepID=A0A1G9E7B0_9RHOB|nr:Hint domain-containing protein [Aliiruegeria lutimaris]SDK72019.1 Hint domain-containing protein [Aliiruegeria lutimaris]